MKIFECILSGDEMISDSYDMEDDGLFYRVEGKWVTIGDVEVNIGQNASENPDEEPEEGVDSVSRKVVDLVDAFQYQETSYDKKAFMAYIKEYMKALLEKLPEDRAEAFKAAANTEIKEKLIGRFSELQFFLGQSGNMEGSMAFAYYKEGAAEPTFLFFRDALKGRKV